MVVEPTPLKNMLVKLDHFPKFRGEHKKYLRCHHPNNQYNQPTSKVSNQPLRFHIHTPSPCYSRLHGGFHGHGTSLTAASCQGNSLGRWAHYDWCRWSYGDPQKIALYPGIPPPGCQWPPGLFHFFVGDTGIHIQLVVSTHLKHITLSSWIISPRFGQGENKQYWKPPSSIDG